MLGGRPHWGAFEGEKVNNKFIFVLLFSSFCLFSCNKQKQQTEIIEQTSDDWFDDFIQETNKQGFSNKNETKDDIQNTKNEEYVKTENIQHNIAEEDQELIKEDEQLAESLCGIYCPNGIYDSEQNIELSKGNKGNIIIKGLGYSTHKVYVRSLINGNEAYITSGDFMNRHRGSEDRICIENNILYYREYFDDYDGQGYYLVRESVYEKMEK